MDHAILEAHNKAASLNGEIETLTKILMSLNEDKYEAEERNRGFDVITYIYIVDLQAALNFRGLRLYWRKLKQVCRMIRPKLLDGPHRYVCIEMP